MKCQDARPIFQRKIVVKQKESFLNLSGHCRECKTVMFKSYKIDDLPQIKRTFHLLDVLELYDYEASPFKTHLQGQDAIPSNESLYGAHYGDLFE